MCCVFTWWKLDECNVGCPVGVILQALHLALNILTQPPEVNLTQPPLGPTSPDNSTEMQHAWPGHGTGNRHHSSVGGQRYGQGIAFLLLA